jgi:dsRNA-specific ribonuclease
MAQSPFFVDNIDIVDYFSFVSLDDESPPESPLHEPEWNDAYELLDMRSMIPDTLILNEICRMSGLPDPVYEVSRSDTGEYLAEVTVGDTLVFRTTAPGHASVAARTNVAGVAIDFLSTCPSAFYHDEHEKSTAANEKKLLIPEVVPCGSYILTLEKLCKMNGFESPVYDFNDPPYEDEWICIVTIFIKDDEFYQLEEGEVFRSKREAKKDAARAAYEAFVKMA